MSAVLTAIEPSTRLSPLVYRILGANPGSFTLQGTNTYLVGSSNRKILIDTGEQNVKAYTTELKRVLRENEILCIICTHWHGDHVGGIPDVLNKVICKKVPVYKLQRTDAWEDSSRYEYVEDGQVFSVPGATLRVLTTLGHTMDHISLLLEEENAIFCGDSVLGETSAVFDDLYAYMLTLNKFLDLKPTRLYPGHGPVIENPVEKIKDYISHRNAREKQVLEILSTKNTATVFEITDAIYTNLSWMAKMGALNNVQHHLTKLLKEKKVEKTDTGVYRLARSLT